MEVIVRRKLPGYAHASGIASGCLGLGFEVGDRDGEEGGEEEGGVGRLNVLIYIGRCLFEDEGPEIGDLRDGFGTAFVEWFCEGNLLAD